MRVTNLYVDVYVVIPQKCNRENENTRSRPRRCSIKTGVLEIVSKFTGKHLCQSRLFKKVTGLRPATLLKKRLWHKRFPVNFARFSRTPFLQNTSARLLLKHSNEINQ